MSGKSAELCYIDDFEPAVPIEVALEQAREGRELALTPALRATGLRVMSATEILASIGEIWRNPL